MRRSTTSNSSRKARAKQAQADRQIRADFDRESIVVYQAYSDPIADAALEAGHFVAPFSFQRMTWIKPSFRWLMSRSHWASRAGQTRILAVRIGRPQWERALGAAVLTDPDPSVYADATAWRQQFDETDVHVQWDPERSLRGKKLEQRSLQVGIGRGLVREFAEEWVLGVSDLTKVATRIRKHLATGDTGRARRLLPTEKRYPLSERIARTIAASRS